MQLRHLLSLDTDPTRAVPGDTASDLLYAAQAFVDGDILWHGHYSSVGIPHPGPVMLWILGVGWRVGPLVGTTHAFGAYVAYALACSSILVAAAALVASVTRRYWYGMAFLWVTLLTVATDDNALLLWAPRFVTLLVVLFAVACITTAARHRLGPVALATSGMLLAHVYLETALVGFIAMVIATAAAWRTGSRTIRLVATAPAALTAVVAIGRLTTEGFDLPLRYVRQGAERRAQSGLPSIVDVLGPVSAAWVAAAAAAVASAAYVVSCKWPPNWRRWPVVLPVSLFALHGLVGYAGPGSGQHVLFGALLPSALVTATAPFLFNHRVTISRPRIALAAVAVLAFGTGSLLELHDVQVRSSWVWTAPSNPRFDFETGQGTTLLTFKSDSRSPDLIDLGAYRPALVYALENDVVMCADVDVLASIPPRLLCSDRMVATAAVAMRADEVPEGWRFTEAYRRGGVTVGLAWTDDIAAARAVAAGSGAPTK